MNTLLIWMIIIPSFGILVLGIIWIEYITSIKNKPKRMLKYLKDQHPDDNFTFISQQYENIFDYHSEKLNATITVRLLCSTELEDSYYFDDNYNYMLYKNDILDDIKGIVQSSFNTDKYSCYINVDLDYINHCFTTTNYSYEDYIKLDPPFEFVVIITTANTDNTTYINYLKNLLNKSKINANINLYFTEQDVNKTSVLSEISIFGTTKLIKEHLDGNL